MVAEKDAGLCLVIRAAELLPEPSMAVRRFSVLAHCQASFTVIRIPNQVIKCFDIVAFIREEGIFLQRERLICGIQNGLDDVESATFASVVSS